MYYIKTYVLWCRTKELMILYIVKDVREGGKGLCILYMKFKFILVCIYNKYDKRNCIELIKVT